MTKPGRAMRLCASAFLLGAGLTLAGCVGGGERVACFLRLGLVLACGFGKRRHFVSQLLRPCFKGRNDLCQLFVIWEKLGGGGGLGSGFGEILRDFLTGGELFL